MRPERYTYQYDRPQQGKAALRRRLFILVLVVVATLLLILNRAHNARLTEIRAELGDFIAPIMQVVTVPVRGFHNWVADKNALMQAHEENQRLREENDTLRQWESVSKALKAENENLRKLADYRPVDNIKYVAAQVIGQSPDAYTGKLLINVGSGSAIPSLAPVIDAEGLIGRTMVVGDHGGRVLFLPDPPSRIPVITADTRHRAILTGTGDELLHMTFVSGDADEIKLGETVMTTAQGGLMPESVMVGTVFRRDADGDLLVKLPRPLAQAEYVRVMVAP